MTPAKPSWSSREVLIVVPCLNEEAHLDALLSNLLIDAGSKDATIVVVDGGSSDQSPSIVRRFSARDPRVILLDNPKRFQSAGVNLAAQRFGGDRRWLVRVDAHATYPHDYVAQLLDTAIETHADSVVVTMSTLGTTCFQTAAAAAQNSLLGNGGARHRTSNAGGWVDHGHHALFSLEAFAAVGGYDETYSHNEDAELDCRLVRIGRRIWLSNTLAILYYPRSTARALFKQYRSFGAGRARTIMRHKLRPKVRQMLPSGVLPALVLALATPWLPIAVIPALIWFGGCMAIGLRIGLTKKTFCAFGAGFAAAIMHLGWSIGFWESMLHRPIKDRLPEPFAFDARGSLSR